LKISIALPHIHERVKNNPNCFQESRVLSESKEEMEKMQLTETPGLRESA